MLPVLVRIGPVAVYSYGVMLAFAFVACWLVARWYLPRHRIDREVATDVALAAAVGGIIGARLLFVITEWPIYVEHPLWIFMLQQGGMVFWGGLAGGALAVFLYVRRKKLPVAVIADGAALTVPLGSAIGRLGCFLNGCCAGEVTDAWFGVTFPNAGVAVVPTQLVDSLANLAIVAVLLAVYLRRRPVPGALWWGYLVLYGVSRFSVEILRVNPPLAFGLTQAQWIAIPVALAGVVGLAWMLGKVRRYAGSLESGTGDADEASDADPGAGEERAS